MRTTRNSRYLRTARAAYARLLVDGRLMEANHGEGAAEWEERLGDWWDLASELSAEERIQVMNEARALLAGLFPGSGPAAPATPSHGAACRG
jgi:hypothetical protein